MKAVLSIGVAAACLIATFAQAQQKPDRTRFTLTPNPAFLACLAKDSASPPQANVVVRRGKLNDRLSIDVYGLKPNLAFDLFTVQRSNLDASGSPDPGFAGSFGLAWYQTDLQADDEGTAHAEIRTILLDQIFGFDADKRADGTTVLPPTNTFHVGFWFNNPQDAAPCGFDETKPTPFNGEHKAGPLAMISLPDATTKLGPLCTSPTGASPEDTTTLACNP